MQILFISSSTLGPQALCESKTAKNMHKISTLQKVDTAVGVVNILVLPLSLRSMNSFVD